MHVRFSYDRRFDALIDTIKKTYGEEILKFSGVHPEQMDMARFTRDFLFDGNTHAVADQSVDANANVDDRSVVSFDYEVAKALSKQNSLNMLWENIIEDVAASAPSHATRIANEAIEQIIT